MESIHERLAAELSLPPARVRAVIELLDVGNTIPFIARYRKEATGSMDDTALRALYVRLEALRALEARRAEVLRALEAQGVLTHELSAALDAARTLAEVEDIYRPYRPKRRTRATVARERGLEPLAARIYEQTLGNPAKWAEEFLDPSKGVETAQAALDGALDIIAEWVSDDAALRKALRESFLKTGQIVSKAACEGDSVYRLYTDFAESCAKIPSHRLLAINRGEREEWLKVGLFAEEGQALQTVCAAHVKAENDCGRMVARACEDAYKRLLFPSLEREIRALLTERASEQAIGLFSLNLRQLLLCPPVRGRVAMGLDPAYRTGCKVAVVDETGRLIDTAVVYPTPPQNRVEEAAAVVTALIKKHNVTIIAIGNGTASHETEVFAAGLLPGLPGVSYMVVSEAGASVYSASELAAEEFPDLDVTLRSAASIARRLQDPLAELVKIDPKAIGVGQYQHDMPPARLSESLSGVVEDCVNTVGVELNTASPALLARVAGLGPALSKNIVTFREQNGPFSDRKALKKVPKLGPRAYEQCAGFLRISGGKNPLDNTGVHPESYAAAEKLLALCGLSPKKLTGGLPELSDKVRALGEATAAQEVGVGLPTLRDMVRELSKPGRDPREELPPPLLRTDILDMKSLVPGMVLAGTVRNITDFGLFVDIGVHQDGLVHVSQLAERFVRHPSEAARVGDIVSVTVLSVDAEKKRISLTMKKQG